MIYRKVQCSYRLPEDARDVCGFIKGQIMTICCYDNGLWYTDEEGCGVDITEWLEPVETATEEDAGLLVDFLLHLNDKGLINNYDFDYEREAKLFIKKQSRHDIH